jgi:hypothetical protein
MFVEELEGSLLLVDSDEFLGAFTGRGQWRWSVVYLVKEGRAQRILRLGVRWRRHAGQLGFCGTNCSSREGLKAGRRHSGGRVWSCCIGTLDDDVGCSENVSLRVGALHKRALGAEHRTAGVCSRTR